MMSHYFSPLRYPGGKKQLYPLIEDIIRQNGLMNCCYIEPFAGGAAIAIKLLVKGVVSRVVINDLDRGIYAFWYSVLYHYDQFIDLLMNTEVTLEERNIQKTLYNQLKKDGDLLRLGFATFFLNRTNRSGIIHGGPIGGTDQNAKYKIDCRFNKKDLLERFELIKRHRNQIDLFCLDANEFIRDIIPRYSNQFVFIDPPYYLKSQDLYMNFFQEQDHYNLSQTILNHLDAFRYIISYDDQPRIRDIYSSHCITSYQLTYSAGNVSYGNEILIYKEHSLSLPTKYLPKKSSVTSTQANTT